MDMRDLLYFEAVARHGNISRAASELHITQPPLSKQIQDLEEEIGFTLFIRTKRGMLLTREGQLFLAHVRPVLRQFSNLAGLATELSQDISGQVTIATVPSFMPFLAKFIYEHVDGGVKFNIREGTTRTVVALVRERGADLGIIRLPILVDSSEVKFLSFGEDPINVFVSDKHPLYSQDFLTPEMLRHYKLALVRGSIENNGFTRIVLAFEEAGVIPLVSVYVDNIVSLIEIIKVVGLCGLAPASTTFWAPPSVRAIPFATNKLISTPLAIIWLEDNPSRLVNVVQKELTATYTAATRAWDL